MFRTTLYSNILNKKKVKSIPSFNLNLFLLQENIFTTISEDVSLFSFDSKYSNTFYNITSIKKYFFYFYMKLIFVIFILIIL